MGSACVTMNANSSKENQKRKKIKKTPDGGDGISVLPDCVLQEILHRLPTTADAIRTGVVSKRWLSLWTAIPNVIFLQECHPKLSSHAFAAAVDKTLENFSLPKLKIFKVSMKYHPLLNSQIYSWIHRALRHNVEELHFGFTGLLFKFKLPMVFFTSSSFTNLGLRSCSFEACSLLNEPVGWKKLKSLTISDSYITDKGIENILSGSPQLENLELRYCFGFSRLIVTSGRMKCLVVSGIDGTPGVHFDRVLEISAPSVSSLVLDESFPSMKIRLQDVSSLVKAKLNIQPLGLSHDNVLGNQNEEEVLVELLRNLRHVNELTIGECYFEMFYRVASKGLPFRLPKTVTPLGSFGRPRSFVRSLSATGRNAAEVEDL